MPVIVQREPAWSLARSFVTNACTELRTRPTESFRGRAEQALDAQVPAWTAGIVRRILCEAERCHVCLVHGSCSFPSPSACASELYFVALWLPGSGCFAPFFTRHCRGGSVFMGQVQGSHDVLVESLLQLPPQWLQLIRQALDQVERAQGSSWSWAAPPSEANVDTRHWGQATDVPCVIPCTSRLAGYCSRNKRPLSP